MWFYMSLGGFSFTDSQSINLLQFFYFAGFTSCLLRSLIYGETEKTHSLTTFSGERDRRGDPLSTFWPSSAQLYGRHNGPTVFRPRAKFPKDLSSSTPNIPLTRINTTFSSKVAPAEESYVFRPRSSFNLLA
jgi:hypothetical protein